MKDGSDILSDVQAMAARAKDTANSPAPVTIKYGEVRAVVEQPGHAQNKKPSSL